MEGTSTGRLEPVAIGLVRYYCSPSYMERYLGNTATGLGEHDGVVCGQWLSMHAHASSKHYLSYWAVR